VFQNIDVGCYRLFHFFYTASRKRFKNIVDHLLNFNLFRVCALLRNRSACPQKQETAQNGY
jgi:hypothetical protein